jgi:hypothetical protein
VRGTQSCQLQSMAEAALSIRFQGGSATDSNPEVDSRGKRIYAGCTGFRRMGVKLTNGDGLGAATRQNNTLRCRIDSPYIVYILYTMSLFCTWVY